MNLSAVRVEGVFVNDECSWQRVLMRPLTLKVG